MQPSGGGLRSRLAALRGSRATQSTLLVPVPEAEFVHERWTGDRAALGVPGLPLHVTVLYPFIEPPAIDAAVEHELRALARSHPAFEYSLSAVDRFPGVLYLSPSPSDPFIALTEAVHARWPSNPPYEGAFEEVVPHVTLALGDEPPGLAAAVAPALPVSAVALELALLELIGGTWKPRARFPLGG